MIELKDEAGNPATANPVDGKSGSTPKMSVDEEGYWCYQIGDGAVQRVPGPYNVAEVDKINPSIFEEVKVKEGNNNVLQFKPYGSDSYVEVALLGGLDMTFSAGPYTLSTSSSSLTLMVDLKEVADVVISPTPLEVKLTDADTDYLTISIPAGTTLSPDQYDIYFEIYNAAGHRLVKKLTVTVE